MVRPAATALVFGEEALSYAELNGRANWLAHRLIALGVKPEAKVGIAVERAPSRWWWGCWRSWKAGGLRAAGIPSIRPSGWHT